MVIKDNQPKLLEPRFVKSQISLFVEISSANEMDWNYFRTLLWGKRLISFMYVAESSKHVRLRDPGVLAGSSLLASSADALSLSQADTLRHSLLMPYVASWLVTGSKTKSSNRTCLERSNEENCLEKIRNFEIWNLSHKNLEILQFTWLEWEAAIDPESEYEITHKKSDMIRLDRSPKLCTKLEFLRIS